MYFRHIFNTSNAYIAARNNSPVFDISNASAASQYLVSPCEMSIQGAPHPLYSHHLAIDLQGQPSFEPASVTFLFFQPFPIYINIHIIVQS